MTAVSCNLIPRKRVLQVVYYWVVFIPEWPLSVSGLYYGVAFIMGWS